MKEHSMAPDDLRALADALEPMARAPRFEDFDVPGFCAWVRACADAKPVGMLTVATFRGHLENRDFDYTGDLPDGNYPLYTHPAPAAPQAEPIFCRDTGCSCNDELPDYAAEQAEPKRLTVEVSLAAGHGYHGYWGVAIGSGVLRFALAAPFATLTEADEYAETLRTALGITGGSDAE